MSNSVSRLREVEIYNHLNDKVRRAIFHNTVDDTLPIQVNQSKEDHEDTNLALLYSILTDPSTASKVCSSH